MATSSALVAHSAVHVQKITSTGWHQGLHELRASPATLQAIGAQSFEWLLIGGHVICFAAVEHGIQDGWVAAHDWMLRRLGLQDGGQVRLERYVDGGHVSASPPPNAAARVVFERAVRAAASTAQEGDTSESEDGEVDAYDYGEEDTEEAQAMGDVRATAQPFDAAAVRAARRQLVGMPLVQGCVYAVQRLYGACILSVLDVDSAGTCVGSATAMDVREDEQPQPQALPAAGEHGAAVVAALCAHAGGLLASKARNSNIPSGSERLASVALRGGHTLLCGPAGNGKMRALRTIGGRLRDTLGATVVRLRCARVLAAAFTGELDSTLDALFDTARRQAPAVVLVSGLKILESIDASDASSTTTTAGGADPTQMQVAAALLERMRGAPRGVLVVASVAEPSALPACLRAHGGFEILYTLPPPTVSERTIMLSTWLPAHADPVTSSDGGDESIAVLTAASHAARLARLTASYSIRDLRRVLAATNLLAQTRARTSTSPMVPTWGDVLEALQLAKPCDDHTAALQSALVHAQSAWERIGGYATLRARLQRLVHLHADYAAACASGTTAGVLQPPSGALLYGPAGNGKTALVECLANACGWPTLHVTGAQLHGAYVGETEANIRKVFRTARERAPSILVFDNLDALGASRGGLGDDGEADGGSSVAERALSTLLNEMDGVGFAGPASAADAGSGGSSAARPAVFLVGCTNRPDLVDAALMRPGRLEQLLHVRHPQADEREAVLQVHARARPLAADVELGALAHATNGFSCADLKLTCEEGARQALDRCLDLGWGRRRGRRHRAGDGADAAEPLVADESGESDGGESDGGESESSEEEDGLLEDDGERLRVEREVSMAVEVTQRDLVRAARLVRRNHVPEERERMRATAIFEAFEEGGRTR